MEIENYIPDVLKNVREFISLAAAENPALENVSDAVDTVMAEQFVKTADKAGVKRYEAIVKITPKDSDTLDERKFAILAKYNARLPFTEKRVNEILASLCGEDGYSCDLSIADQTCTVKLALINKKMRSTVSERLDEILPLDLYLSVVIMYNQHQTFTGMTHEQMAAYTHQQLREEVM
ncbi:MAG: YmfQ family protein [Clostridia bacterium]|jgi:hypothetical protein|nr:YmfQ family protein [Clostridia bacterium]